MTSIMMNDPRSHPLDLALIPLLENLAQATTVRVGGQGAFASAQIMKGGKKIPLHDGPLALRAGFDPRA